MGRLKKKLIETYFKMLAPLQTKLPTFPWMVRRCSLYNSSIVMRIMRRRLEDGHVKGRSKNGYSVIAVYVNLKYCDINIFR